MDSRRLAIINTYLTIALIALTTVLIVLTIVLARDARRLDVLTHSLIGQPSSPPPEQSPTPIPTAEPVPKAIPIATPTPNPTPSPSAQSAGTRHRRSRAQSQIALHPVRVMRVSDDAGNVIETHEHAGDFKEP